MKRGSPEYLAALHASMQRGMLVSMLFTAVMGAFLYVALVAAEAPKHPQIAQEQTR